jgi:hypothetical protein
MPALKSTRPREVAFFPAMMTHLARFYTSIEAPVALLNPDSAAPETLSKILLNPTIQESIGVL